MIFDKNHLVNIETLSCNEAEAFLIFLRVEKNRHVKAASQSVALSEFWNSEARRQVESVGQIDDLIHKVELTFGLKKGNV